jgi:hypothetical protein
MNDRTHDLRRQAAEFIRDGGFIEPHNRKAGSGRTSQQVRNRKARRAGKQKMQLAMRSMTP